MPPAPAEVNRGTALERKKSEIEHGLPFIWFLTLCINFNDLLIKGELQLLSRNPIQDRQTWVKLKAKCNRCKKKKVNRRTIECYSTKLTL